MTVVSIIVLRSPKILQSYPKTFKFFVYLPEKTYIGNFYTEKTYIGNFYSNEDDEIQAYCKDANLSLKNRIRNYYNCFTCMTFDCKTCNCHLVNLHTNDECIKCHHILNDCTCDIKQYLRSIHT
jgi:hypothetical protein